MCLCEDGLVGLITHFNAVYVHYFTHAQYEWEHPHHALIIQGDRQHCEPYVMIDYVSNVMYYYINWYHMHVPTCITVAE